MSNRYDELTKEERQELLDCINARLEVVHDFIDDADHEDAEVVAISLQEEPLLESIKNKLFGNERDQQIVLICTFLQRHGIAAYYEYPEFISVREGRKYLQCGYANGPLGCDVYVLESADSKDISSDEYQYAATSDLEWNADPQHQAMFIMGVLRAGTYS